MTIEQMIITIYFLYGLCVTVAVILIVLLYKENKEFDIFFKNINNPH